MLRDEVIPLYYDRDRDGLPREWIARMKRAIRTLGWRFSADRMVMDYVLQVVHSGGRRHEQRRQPALSHHRDEIVTGIVSKAIIVDGFRAIPHRLRRNHRLFSRRRFPHLAHRLQSLETFIRGFRRHSFEGFSR